MFRALARRQCSALNQMAFDAGSLLSFLKLDTKGFSTGLSTAKGKVNQFDSSIGKSDKTLKSMSGTAAGLGKLMLTGLGFFAAFKAVTAFTRAIGDSISMAADLEKSMANVATLVDTTVVSMEGLTDSVLEMTSEVLKSADDLSAGLYQVFSAGVTDSAEAMEVLRVSAIAATAGLSTTLTSVDAITTVLNAYGLEASEATEISDLMFQTVKLGKTTFDQLAVAIGTVISPAASVGIELDELFASLATLTKGGINTMRATTALRATLLSVIKPGDEAKKAAKRLGLEWNAASLKAKGLVQFLADLREATGGNSEVIAELVPNVRALNAVMALTGKQFDELIDIQRQFEDRSGSTIEAFKKQEDTYESQREKLSLMVDEIQTRLGKTFVGALRSMTENIIAFMNATGEEISELSLRIDPLAASLGRLVTISQRLPGIGGKDAPIVDLEKIKRVQKVLENLGIDLEKLNEKRKALTEPSRPGVGGITIPLQVRKKQFEAEIDRIVSLVADEFGALSKETLIPLPAIGPLKTYQENVEKASKIVTEDIRGIVNQLIDLNEKNAVLQNVPKIEREEEESINAKNAAILTSLNLKAEQIEQIDELIGKARELGKTDHEIFLMNTADIREIVSSREFDGERKAEILKSLEMLELEILDKMALKKDEQAQKDIDRATKVKDAQIRALNSFNRQFENAGKTQLQIVERNEQRAIAKATDMGQKTAQITRFFEEKKTQIKQQEQQKQLQAAGTFATATGDLANNLNQLVIQSGKEGSKELFIIMKVAAIANAIVSTAVGITRALELGIPLGPPAAALVGAAGAAQVAVIAGTALKEGGLVTEPTNALVGEAGPEAVIPIEQGVAPIVEESVRSVAEEGQQGPGVTIINVNDERKLRAIVADQQARTSEQVVLNILGRRNNRTVIGENTLSGVL